MGPIDHQNMRVMEINAIIQGPYLPAHALEPDCIGALLNSWTMLPVSENQLILIPR
jgi:hypothetical protein